MFDAEDAVIPLKCERTWNSHKNWADLNYLRLVEDVLRNGELTPTRAKIDGKNVSAYSVFGRQVRFPLQDGFPILTTKKINFNAIVHELIWFLSGSSNIQYLKDNGVKIWDDWVTPEGNVGPAYGFQWRNFGGKPDCIIQPKPNLREGLERTYLGVGNGQGKSRHPLQKTWEGMLMRCYDKNFEYYNLYGGKGVFVCDRWLEFTKFAEDAINLPGYKEKLLNTNTRYVLDKDILGTGFEYSPNTCQWITDGENTRYAFRKIYKVEKDGEIFEFYNPSEFCRSQGIPNNNFSDLWTTPGTKHRHGFRLIEVKEIGSGVDQIKQLIENIETVKQDPTASCGRRLIITAWHPYYVDKVGLPPCHCFVQFHVRGDKLSCQLYQRSADLFLGVPFNISSYALLTHIVAYMTGLVPHEFIHTYGDVHIYENHVDQLREQLKRTPYRLPTLTIRSGIDSIDELRREDFLLSDYKHHPFLRGEVAV